MKPDGSTYSYQEFLSIQNVVVYLWKNRNFLWMVEILIMPNGYGEVVGDLSGERGRRKKL